MDGQGTKRRRKIAEYFNRLSKAHEQTDRQTTDGKAIAYSERKREFTFAKMIQQFYLSIQLSQFVTLFKQVNQL